MSELSIGEFFYNPDLISMQGQLSYENVDEMRVLLTNLLYDKVI